MKEKKLVKWLKENNFPNLSYFWYFENVPVDLEDELQTYRKKYFSSPVNAEDASSE